MGNIKAKIDEYETPWRNTSWGKQKKDSLKQTIKEIKPYKNDLKYLRILVVGPNGSGKSSFINSINNAFKGRITSDALSNTISSKSFTVVYKQYEIETGNPSLTLVINDVMGLEGGFKHGCPLEDIIKAVHGHVKEGHEFIPEKPLSSDDPDYIKTPEPSDQAFCLVNVLAADRIQLTDDSVLGKLRDLRHDVKRLGLPQVIVMTNVDQTCPVVKANLQKVYYSKKIKEKMQWCSNELGVPMCHVFPVKNYHEEIETNDDMDVLILQAVTQIIQLANDNAKIRLTK
ncbi:interferon-induced protein 44-like [Carassius gibelio]|uniref:interferon-induced protein 44-like n=1 Tax=Carassius gibelio TaxID=101364 RepID=UPI0022790E21|nr:interferon-induced protein 44-like [Carassius gibelio]XP_052393126.1 interferon-induced protein 44-like [Carassius gibelio]